MEASMECDTNHKNMDVTLVKEEISEDQDDGMQHIQSQQNEYPDVTTVKVEIVNDEISIKLLSGHNEHSTQQSTSETEPNMQLLPNHENKYHATGESIKIMETDREPQCDTNMFICQTSSSSQNAMEDESHSCDVCHKLFKTKEDLQFHKKKHNRDFTCDVCNKKFNSFSQLSIHYETHTGVRRFKCDICDKGFSLKQTLIDHQVTHTGEKNYICEVCGTKFSQRASWNKHRRSQHVEQQLDNTPHTSHVCVVCDRVFSRADTLREHLKIHTGEQTRKYKTNKEHKCHICDKIFAKSSHLKVHIRIHTGEKPFQCTVCDMRFNANYDLTKHSKKHKP